MKTLILYLGLIILLLTGCVMPRNTVGLYDVLENEDAETKNYRCTMGAHRGDSLFFTENSPQAIRSARENPQYAFIEFDVQYSADHVPVVIHDSDLRRVFHRWNKVKKSQFQTLQALSGNKIATYDEIMDLADGKRVNVEIKSQGDDEADIELAKKIVTDVLSRKIQKKVLISSISDEVVEYIKMHYPKIKVGQIFFVKASTWLPFDSLTEKLYQTTPADYIMLYTANLDNIEDLVKYKPKEKTLVFWDFDDTMYIVHKDSSDRLWGQSAFVNFFNNLRFNIAK